MFRLASIQSRLLAMFTGMLVLTTLTLTLSNWAVSEAKINEEIRSELLPTELRQVADNLNLRIRQLTAIAEQLATSPLAQQMVNDGKSAEAQAQLVRELTKIRDVHGLQQTSFCDRTTGDYWNNDGFLRRLNPEQDGWFFKFKDSGKRSQVAVYLSETLGYQIFVNYQQADGMGLAGVARSLNDMVEMIKSYHIGKTGVVYLVDQQGNIVIHPQLKIGTPLSEVVGAPFAQQLQQASEQPLVLSGELQGANTLLAAMALPEAGWTLVAQVPTDDFLGALWSTQYLMWLLAGLMIGVGLLVAYWFAQSITKPIRTLAAMFQQLAGRDADLTTQLTLDFNQELNELAHGFNQFVRNLHQVVADVRSRSALLSNQAQQLSQHASSSLNSTEQQQQISRSVLDALTQMQATVQEIAGHAALTAQTTQQTNQRTDIAVSQVQSAKQLTEQVSNEISRVSQQVHQLASQTDAITQILDVIHAVADQTNLLALNAAIEAARAGEHGRGFAVVADEVRNLASRTSKSAAEIQQLITGLHHNTDAAVAAVQTAINQAGTSMTRSDQVHQELSHVSQQVQQLEQMNVQVAAATEEQSVVTADVTEQLRAMASQLQHSLTQAGQLQQNAEGLSRIATELSGLANRFRL